MTTKFIKYTATAKNLYPVFATLYFFRVPFEFIPRKKWKIKEFKSMRNNNVVEFDLLKDGPVGISEILYEMDSKYGDIFGFTILQEIEY